MWKLEETARGFTLALEGKTLLRHSEDAPMLFAGRGEEKIDMYRGNFDITDRVSERWALRYAGAVSSGEDTVLRFVHPCLTGELRVTVTEKDGVLFLDGAAEDGTVNRLYLRLAAEKGEHVMGGGEQFSCLDLRGRLFPIWTREQGVGRNKLTEITRLADLNDRAGGDYHTTFYPQPSFVSSRLYFAHLGNYEYAELDFRDERFHEIGLWASHFSLALGTAESYRGLAEKLSGLLGRQRELPDWAMRGIWLGAQGGSERVTALLDKCRRGGMEIPAVWIQDWEGKRVTSFGKRLQWDWRWNREMYPGLDELIARDPDTRWMGYINPYLVEGGVLFDEARNKGYFVKNAAGEDYLFDFGEYDCGVVDLTMPEAFGWYKDVIKKNLIGLGLRGWMADFGEYLPADAVCCGGSGREMHNLWPLLWARCNREAVDECGLGGECGIRGGPRDLPGQLPDVVPHHEKPPFVGHLLDPAQGEPPEPPVALHVAEHGLHVGRTPPPQHDPLVAREPFRGLLPEFVAVRVHVDVPVRLAGLEAPGRQRAARAVPAAVYPDRRLVPELARLLALADEGEAPAAAALVLVRLLVVGPVGGLGRGPRGRFNRWCFGRVVRFH